MKGNCLLDPGMTLPPSEEESFVLAEGDLDDWRELGCLEGDFEDPRSVCFGGGDFDGRLWDFLDEDLEDGLEGGDLDDRFEFFLEVDREDGLEGDLDRWLDVVDDFLDTSRDEGFNGCLDFFFVEDFSSFMIRFSLSIFQLFSGVSNNLAMSFWDLSCCIL